MVGKDRILPRRLKTYPTFGWRFQTGGEFPENKAFRFWAAEYLDAAQIM